MFSISSLLSSWIRQFSTDDLLSTLQRIISCWSNIWIKFENDGFFASLGFFKLLFGGEVFEQDVGVGEAFGHDVTLPTQADTLSGNPGTPVGFAHGGDPAS